MTADTRPSTPLLIIGAGLTGLLLAQACRKERIPYRIFDQDASESSSGRSPWCLTLHWSLPTLPSLLPEDIIARLAETYVHEGAVDDGEKSTFTVLDLSTGEVKFNLPSGHGIRVSEERLRRLLLTGIAVEWGKKAVALAQDIEGSGVSISFADGASTTGAFVVATDGANSTIRRLLHTTQHANHELPIRMLSTTVLLSESQLAPLRAINPSQFCGVDPHTDTFLSFSQLDPSSNDSTSGHTRYHLTFSWPHRPAWLGRVDPTNTPNTDIGQLSLMQTVAANWAEPFRSLITAIPLGNGDDPTIWPVPLLDWIPAPRPLDSALRPAWADRCVLAGDAAHAMPPFRAEGPNHAVADAATLLPLLRSVFLAGRGAEDAAAGCAALVRAYEEEMLPRGELAVRASRQAGLDAHEAARVTATSLLVRRQGMRSDLEMAAAAAAAGSRGSIS